MTTALKLRTRRTKARGLHRAIVVDVANRQRRQRIDATRLVDAVRTTLHGEGVRRANVSLAIVDNPTIHALNRQFLDHDEPTDVISFVLDGGRGFVDGEIVVSADAAAVAAPRFGWPASAELLLYVIHGALHLAGHDDRRLPARRQMRAAERRYLAQFGLQPPRAPKGSSRKASRSPGDKNL